MGIFSTKKKTYVSSVLYNMAGEEKDRPNYLKGLVVGNVITSSSFSASETLKSGYLAGPGVKLRNFYRWAEDNYDAIGIPKSTLYGSPEIDNTILETQLPHDPSHGINIQNAEYGPADFSYWAEQWMLLNEPSLANSEWEADIDNDTNVITITFEDTTTESFTPVGFDKNANYIYTAFKQSGGLEPGPVVTGTLTSVALGSLPSTSGWSTDSFVSTPTTSMLHDDLTITVSYSDGRPDEVTYDTSATPSSYTNWVGRYKKEEYLGQDPSMTVDKLVNHKQDMHQYHTGVVLSDTVNTTTTEEVGTTLLPVTKTTHTTGSSERLELQEKYQIDTQDVILSSWYPLEIYIYRIGSGNAILDAMISKEVVEDEYYPFIPVRINNKFLSDTFQPDDYELSKKAYKKSTGGDYDDIIENLKDNDSLSDIDYAYVAFGVPLNVQEKSSRKYLYNYFHKLMGTQSTSSMDYSLWQLKQLDFSSTTDEWNTWKVAQDNPSDPLYGTTAPAMTLPRSIPISEVRIKTSSSLDTHFDMQITWSNITEDSGTGLKKPDAKVGDIWFDNPSAVEYDNPLMRNQLIGIVADRLNINTTYLNWQVTVNSWKRLKIINMVHKNYIYNGKYVETNMEDALADADDSSFLVPLHYDTYRQMSMVDSTQMATACCYMVFNSYKVVKQKWYQTGIFKILVIIAIIAITVAFPPAGGAAGLLGTSAAVGASIGLTGLAAIIAGTIANMIAAMIVTKLISAASVAVFGDKLGAIIGMVASFAALQVGTAVSNGATLAQSVSHMGSAINILKLTMAAGDGISGYMAGSAAEIAAKAADVQKDYEKESKRLSDLYAQDIGYGRALLDPMDLLDAKHWILETGDQFLSRTLMTGSEVADLSLNLITQFASLTLTTELPI